jgi:Xaa-Pro aminopeptidase
VIGYVQGIRTHFNKAIQSLHPASIAINYSKKSEICDGLSHGMYLTLRSYLEEIGYEGRLLSAEKIISALRARKTGSELGYIREAIRATEQIFSVAADFIRLGRTDKDIAYFMKSEVEELQLYERH